MKRRLLGDSALRKFQPTRCRNTRTGAIVSDGDLGAVKKKRRTMPHQGEASRIDEDQGSEEYGDSAKVVEPDGMSNESRQYPGELFEATSNEPRHC